MATDSFKILSITNSGVEVELIVGSNKKGIVYPSNLTDEEILVAIEIEMQKMKDPEMVKSIFVMNNIGKEMLIDKKQVKQPDRFDTLYSAVEK